MTDASPTRPPLWMLAKKELRLQQMTFAMVAVYALIWTGLTVAGELNADFAREFPMMRGVGLLYFARCYLCSWDPSPARRSGSSACSNRRRCCPRPAMGGESECCARPCTRARRGSAVVRIRAAANLPHIVLAAGGEHRASDDVEPYISSWCGSGIIALALLLPASAAAMALARWIDWTVSALLLPQRSAGAYAVLTQPFAVFTTWVIAATPLAVLLLVFAARNHWTSERKPKTLAVQVAGARELAALHGRSGDGAIALQQPQTAIGNHQISNSRKLSSATWTARSTRVAGRRSRLRTRTASALAR